MFVKTMVIVVFCLLFWAGCYLGTGTDQKNMKGFRSYPVSVQRLVREEEDLALLIPKQTSPVVTVISNVIVFAVIFTIIGVILKFTVGFHGFADAFVYLLVLGEVLNLFDLAVIDLFWWRNSKRIRFSSIPDKKLYQSPRKHIDSFLRGIPAFAVAAVIGAAVISLL